MSRLVTPTFEASGLLVLRRASWWRWVLSLLPIVAWTVWCLHLDFLAVGWYFLVFGFVIPALSAATWLIRTLAKSRRVTATVRAGAEGVEIAGRFHPRAEIVRGSLLHTPHRVILHRRFRPPLEIDATSTRQGRALLRALGLDASQRVADFVTFSLLVGGRGSLFAGVVAAFVLGLVAFSLFVWHSHGAGMLLFAGLPLLWVIALLAPAWVRVGTDGIGVRWLWGRRFFHFDAMEEIDRFGKWGPFLRAPHVVGLRVVLRSGKDVRLPVVLAGLGKLRLELLTERVLQALASFREGADEAAADLLRRGDRSVGAWVRALRSLGSGANVDARTAPVPRDRLLRIVEDPSLPPLARAAAAVALGPELDDEGRGRLRLAAEASALPRLRVAIETAAGGAEAAELEAALAEIEGEAPSLDCKIPPPGRG